MEKPMAKVVFTKRNWKLTNETLWTWMTMVDFHPCGRYNVFYNDCVDIGFDSVWIMVTCSHVLCSLLRTWKELINYIIFPGNSQSWNKSWNFDVYLLFSENDGLWRQTHETPKTPCFWKGNWMPSFLRYEGWVEQSESCLRKRWKSPAKSRNIFAKLPQISANSKMAESEHFQILGVWGCPHLAVSDSQMTWNTWNSWNHWKAETHGNSWFFFSTRMNLPVV